MTLSFRVLFGLFLASGASAAYAQAEFCVTSRAEFDAAYRLSEIQPVTIKMPTGEWDMAGSSVAPNQANFVYARRSVRIEGGYNNTCTSRSEDPGSTVLTANVLDFSNVASYASTLHIERITFRELSRVELGFSRGEVSLDRVWFDVVAHGKVNAERFSLRNSIVAYGGGGGEKCAIDFFNHNPEVILVEHTTFARNGGPAALCVRDYVGQMVKIYSNVFWENDVDARIDALSNYSGNISALFFNNVLGAGIETNAPLSVPPVATQTSNPQFVTPDNFRLSGTSPAIDSARTNIQLLSDRDFDGNVRWQGNGPDRGAFESNVGSTVTVLTVTNTNNAGIGSLRQALIDANAAPNLNEIRFNISGSCPRTITLASLLPDIVHPVLINGYSQPGSARNTATPGWNANLCIVLNGANQITGAYGFNVNTGASPDATVSIEGIAFSGHSFSAAQFIAGRDHRFVGNQIGGVVGTTLLPSGTGVRIGGAVEGVRVGGPQPAERNVIADALGIGINLSGSGSTQPSSAVIENNYIGTQSGGDVRGSERGLFIASPDHVVRDNVIVNASSHGIELAGNLALRNRITDNRIGVPALCIGTCANRGNAGHGMLLRNNANDNRIESNQIAFSGLDAVAITGARRNSVRRNSMFAQGGIGIDLGDDGRNLFNSNNSQAAPPDAGNDSQNAPVLSSVAGTAAVGLAAGSLSSTNGWYRIDFYGTAQACTLVFAASLPVGFFGEGRDWLGSTLLQISNGSAGTDGSAEFSAVELGREGSNTYFIAGSTWITATATRLSGPPLIGAFKHLGTSEFGRCRQYAAGIVDRIFADGFDN